MSERSANMIHDQWIRHELDIKRRSAVDEYKAAAVIEGSADQLICGPCRGQHRRLVEAVGGAEYHRGTIRGLEIALAHIGKGRAMGTQELLAAAFEIAIGLTKEARATWTQEPNFAASVSTGSDYTPGSLHRVPSSANSARSIERRLP